MRYLIITIVVLALGSCCKKIDDVCCKDGMYVRFENQTEYVINEIGFNNITIIKESNLVKGNTSEFIEISNIIEEAQGDNFSLNVSHNDSLSSYVILEKSLFEDGCSELIITAMAPTNVFGAGIEYNLIKIK